MVAAAVAMLASGLLVYTPPLDVVVLVFLGPGMVASALLAWRPWRALFLVAGLLVAVPCVVVLFVFGEIRWIANPSVGVFGDYVSILLLLLALVFALPAGIAGFVAHRGTRWNHGNPWPHASIAYALAVPTLLLGMAVSGGFVQANIPEGAASYDFLPEASVSVDVKDDGFDPATLMVGRGVITELRIRNQDDYLHTFTYEAGGVVYSHDLYGLKETTFLVRFDETGVVNFWCIPHGETMNGQVNVS